MKLEDMKALEVKQIEDLISEWKQELFKLRVNASIQKKAEKSHMFSLLRKRIARGYTVVRQKQQVSKG